MKKRAALDLGPDVIRRLLPHRRPLLMVDRVVDFVDSPPTLRALRHISSNDAVFDGHFPDLHLWPGALTIEGLAQTCNLLFVLNALVSEGERDAVLAALRNLELRHRLDPGYRPGGADVLETLQAEPRRHIALTTAVDVKLTHPVFAGQRLDYRATHAGEAAGMVRCEVEASVDGRVVARGTITASPLPR